MSARGSLVVVVVLSDLCFDAIKFCLAPHLESFELVKAERVGEMCFEELVLLSEDLLAPFGESSQVWCRCYAGCGSGVSAAIPHPGRGVLRIILESYGLRRQYIDGMTIVGRGLVSIAL